MQSFLDFLRESPHETENTVPVAVYLHQPVDLDRPVQSVLADVRAGRTTHLETVRVTLLVPTQARVNNDKVMSYGIKGLSDDLPPIVFRMEDGRYWIVDGHHRICGDVVQGATEIECRVVNVDEGYA